MDKHQRKRLSRWEQKKGKEQFKFEEYMKRHSYDQASADIERAVQRYDPPAHVVFSRARALALDIRSLIVREGRREALERAALLLPLWGEEEQGPYYLAIGAPHPRRYPYYLTDSEIASEIAAGKASKEYREAVDLAFTLHRHRQRVDAIRDELTLKTTRFRAIQTCRYGFKEELMMKVWHPDRVGKFLETYGWEAFDNLLGVE
jgi:hypothetical protein